MKKNTSEFKFSPENPENEPCVEKLPEVLHLGHDRGFRLPHDSNLFGQSHVEMLQLPLLLSEGQVHVTPVQHGLQILNQVEYIWLDIHFTNKTHLRLSEALDTRFMQRKSHFIGVPH